MTPPASPLEALFEDNHCLAVVKPARLLVAGDKTGDPNLLDQAKAYIKEKYHKPGDVYLGLVHRLDRPVSGIVLFARTSKAAARLSEQFRARTVTKKYTALVSGHMPAPQGTLTDWLLKDEAKNEVRIVPPNTPGAKEARLYWKLLEPRGPNTLLEITLETGRSHQIRTQLSHAHHPLLGDTKYNSSHPLGGKITLHASELTFTHPTTKESVSLTAPIPEWWHQLP